jgi:hypothetical protein
MSWVFKQAHVASLPFTHTFAPPNYQGINQMKIHIFLLEDQHRQITAYIGGSKNQAIKRLVEGEVAEELRLQADLEVRAINLYGGRSFDLPTGSFGFRGCRYLVKEATFEVEDVAPKVPVVSVEEEVKELWKDHRSLIKCVKLYRHRTGMHLRIALEKTREILGKC